MPYYDFDLKSCCRGFTLIEVLVSIGIILMVSAVAIPSLRDFNSTQEVDNAASEFTNVLRRAQSSASSRIQCPAGGPSTSWQVDLSLSTSSDAYTLVSNCQTPPSQTILTNSFKSNPNSVSQLRAVTDACGVSGGQGVNATIFFTNQQLSYQCLGGLVQTASTIKITISDASGKSKVVAIEPGGIIRSE